MHIASIGISVICMEQTTENTRKNHSSLTVTTPLETTEYDFFVVFPFVLFVFRTMQYGVSSASVAGKKNSSVFDTLRISFSTFIHRVSSLTGSSVTLACDGKGRRVAPRRLGMCRVLHDDRSRLGQIVAAVIRGAVGADIG